MKQKILILILTLITGVTFAQKVPNPPAPSQIIQVYKNRQLDQIYAGSVGVGGFETMASKRKLDSLFGVLDAKISAIPIQDLTPYQLKSEKGQANGYAGLDANGKVPLTQINDALLGAVNYRGTYNAATNTPTLPSASSSNKGHYYIVSAAGTQFGLEFRIGDWIISNGSSYGKVSGTADVASVNGRKGVVTGLAELSGGNNFTGTQNVTGSLTVNGNISAIDESNNRVNVNSTGVVFTKPSNNSLTLQAPTITNNRLQTFQDKDGVVALLSDITGGTPPDLTNYARKDQSNIFTANQSLQKDLPLLEFKSTIFNQSFNMGYQSDYTGNFQIRNHQGKKLLTLTNPNFAGSQPQLAIGNISSNIPNESQLYVYGGASGANIDTRGSFDYDETNMDMEGADWAGGPNGEETLSNSLGFSYFGNNFNLGGTILGYERKKLAQIRYNNVETALITSSNIDLNGVHKIVPIRFGIDAVEIANVNDKGLAYQSDFSSANSNNPRWLTDKAYVDAAVAAGGGGGGGGNETLQSVTDRGNITNYRIFSTGSNNHTGLNVRATSIFQDPTGLGYLESYNYSNATPNDLSINASGGNVGIGITTPTEKLDVNGKVKSTHLITRKNNNDSSPIAAFGILTDGYSLLLSRNENSGRYEFTPENPQGFTFNSGVNGSVFDGPIVADKLNLTGLAPDIVFNQTGQVQASAFNTFQFARDNVTQVAIGRSNLNDFYITRQVDGGFYDDSFVLKRLTGNVGIGTNNPNNKLHVVGSITATENNGNPNTLTRNVDLAEKASIYGNNFLGQQSAPTFFVSSATSGSRSLIAMESQGGSTDDLGFLRISSASVNGQPNRYYTTSIRQGFSPTANNTLLLPIKTGTLALAEDLDTSFRKTVSGNGSSTTITFAHGLQSITSNSFVSVIPNNPASAGISYVTVDNTNVNVVYTVAPPAGTNNLIYSVSIK